MSELQELRKKVLNLSVSDRSPTDIFYVIIKAMT